MSRSVVFVGNGPLEPNIASKIDACDLVIRMNACRAFNDEAGCKVDVVALSNTGDTGRDLLSAAGLASNPALQATPEVWLTRSPQFYDAVLAAAGPEAQTYYVSHADLVLRAGYEGKCIRTFSSGVTSSLFRKLMAVEPTFVMPSTGMRVIEEFVLKMRRPSDELYICGFTHQGWAGHPWKAEQKLVGEYITGGLLRRLV